MTLVGAGDDNSNPAIVIGYSGTPEIVANHLTIRDIHSSGHGRAVMTSGGTSGTTANNCLVYNNEFVGQNPWANDYFDSSIGWSDDGIRLVGTGNCVWNNTLQGFGDSITFSHSVKDDSIRACFAYRNFIRNSVDDVFEFDYALRNLAAYDNYIENCSTVMSLDDRPSAGGSIWCFRNVAININVRPFKMNSAGYGYLIYSNTFVRTEAASKNPRGHYRRGWSKLNSTEVDRVAYRNNILIFRAADPLEIMRLRNLAAKKDSSVDWTNNAHFPDIQINWEGDSGKNVFSNLADAKSNIRATNPLFPSGAGLGAPSIRHTDDVICSSNPFVNSIALGPDGATEAKGRTTPTLRSGSAPNNAGVNIPNITDGYSGSQPDMGAVIDGRSPPPWGAN